MSYKNALVLILCFSTVMAYPQLGNDANDTVMPLWSFTTSGKIFGSPSIHQDVLFVGSADSHVYAIDRITGVPRWKFKTGGAVHTTPALLGNLVYFGSFDGFYYGVNVNSGKEVWRFKTGGEKWMGGKGYLGMKPDTLHMDDPWQFYLSSPVVAGTKNKPVLYFGSSDQYVYAIDAKKGTMLWRFRTQGLVHSTPVVDGDMLYVGSWDGILYAINANSGKLIWKYKTGDQPGMSGIQASPVVANGIVFFGARDANFYALDAKTGDLKWKYAANNSWILSSAAVKNGTVYFGTSDSYLVIALDAYTGDEKWKAEMNGYVYSSPAIERDLLYIGDFTGVICAIRLSDGTIQEKFYIPTRHQHADHVLLKSGRMDFMKLAEGKDLSLFSSTVEVMDELYRLGPVVSTPAIKNGILYVSSSDGRVYAFALKSPK